MKKCLAVLLTASLTFCLLLHSAVNFPVSASMPDRNLYLNNPKTGLGRQTYEFTAPVSTQYVLCTTGDADTYATLRDGTDQLRYDDNSGENNNFDITVYLVEGRKYSLEVSSRSSGSYVVSVVTGESNPCYIFNPYMYKHLNCYNQTSLDFDRYSRDQQFEVLQSTEDGAYVICKRNGLLSVDGVSRFTLFRHDDGSFSIKDATEGSNLVLTALSLNAVGMRTYTGSYSQKWRFESLNATLMGSFIQQTDDNGKVIYDDLTNWYADLELSALHLGSTVVESSQFDGYGLVDNIKRSNYAVVTTHGNEAGTQMMWHDSQCTEQRLTNSHLLSESKDSLRQTACLLLVACYLGTGGASNEQNLVNRFHDYGGVGTVVGFQEAVEYYRIDTSDDNVADPSRGSLLFASEFTKKLAAGYTVQAAAKAAAEAVAAKERYLGMYEDPYMGTDTYYIAGNAEAIIKVTD